MGLTSQASRGSGYDRRRGGAYSYQGWDPSRQSQQSPSRNADQWLHVPELTRWPSLTRELGRTRVCPIQDPNNEPCWPAACSALCLGRELIHSPTHLTGKPSRSSGYLHSPPCDPAHSSTCSEHLPVDTARTPAQQSRGLAHGSAPFGSQTRVWPAGGLHGGPSHTGRETNLPKSLQLA